MKYMDRIIRRVSGPSGAERVLLWGVSPQYFIRWVVGVGWMGLVWTGVRMYTLKVFTL